METDGRAAGDSGDRDMIISRLDDDGLARAIAREWNSRPRWDSRSKAEIIRSVCADWVRSGRRVRFDEREARRAIEAEKSRV